MVKLKAPQAEIDLMKADLDNPAQWLIVSKFTMEPAEQRSVEVLKAPGVKCPRCWNYTEEPDADGLCPRCHHVLNK